MTDILRRMLLAQVVPRDVVDDVVEEFETLEARDWIIAAVVMLVAILLAGFAGRAAERRMGGATSLSAVTVMSPMRRSYGSATVTTIWLTC